MSSYGQQWNPNHFNFPLQLEHDIEYSQLPVSAIDGQQQQSQLQPQQGQLTYPPGNYRYPHSQTIAAPHSSSSLDGAFDIPTNRPLPQSPPTQFVNGIRDPYAIRQPQQPATHMPTSNSYHPTFKFSPRAPSLSAMNLNTAQTSNIPSAFFSSPQGSAMPELPELPETEKRQPYRQPPLTSQQGIPHTKRPRSEAYNDDLNPEDADLDSEPNPSDQKDPASRSKL